MPGPKLIIDLPVAQGLNNDYLIAVGSTAGILYQTTLGDISINQSNGGGSSSNYFNDMRYLRLSGDGQTVDQDVNFTGDISLNNVVNRPTFENGINVSDNESVIFEKNGNLSVYATTGDGTSPSIAFPWKSGTVALTSDIDGFGADLANYIPWSALDFTTLVVPIITVTWIANMHDGTTPYTLTDPNAANITVDTGCVVTQGSSWYYPIPSAGQAGPTVASGSYGPTVVGPDTSSDPLNTTVTDSVSYSVTISKPKSGLIVVNNQVTVPSGTDTNSASISVAFKGKGYLFYSTNGSVSASDINTMLTTSLGSMNGSFQSSVGRTYTNVTAGVGLYTYIIYESTFANITTIIMNGATPVLGAFTQESNLTIVNEAQFSILYKVYRTNITQAFTGATLVIS